jgi:hypothetical protein
MKRGKITLTPPTVFAGTIPLTRFSVIVALALVIISGTPSPAEPIAAGFIFDRFRLTLEDGFRTEAAGPFYYSQQSDSERQWAIPPFFSTDDDPVLDQHEDDVLYPLVTSTRYGHERRWQLAQLISFSSGQEPDETGVRRFTIFPIYFQQRAADTNLNYTAVVPFYGRLQNRLFRNEIYFVMFPFYVETRKRDVVTENYFYPFVDVHHGQGMTGWQFWPFAGREHKDITSDTNDFGDVTLNPGHDRAFYLWPFYLRQDNGLGSSDPEKFRASIPFYAITRSPLRDSTTVLWPFFSSIDDRSRNYHEWQGPWPFVVLAHGPGKETTRFWPVFSQSHNATKEIDSYAWPLYVHTRTHSDPLDERRDRVLFYLYDRFAEKNTETGKEKVRLDMWPFFEWHHDFNGDERLQVLALLEPAVPDNRGIERNWSPLWSLWRSEHNAANSASSQSLLWNLYRHQTAPAYRQTSVFFGLYQSSLQDGHRTTRLFFIPLGR